MIRRPRYPLALRLAWFQSELDQAVKLMGLITRDMISLKQQVAEAETRIVIVATVAVAALLPLGVDGELVELFMAEIMPTGDLEEAEELAEAIIGQVVLILVPDDEGEGH